MLAVFDKEEEQDFEELILFLRRKLKNPDLIQTMVGRGYRFVGE